MGSLELLDIGGRGQGIVLKHPLIQRRPAKEKIVQSEKGGLGGALIGTAIMPGVGSVIGYAASSHKDTKHKNKENQSTTVSSYEYEVISKANMTLMDVSSGESFTFGFECSTRINNLLLNYKIFQQPELSESESIDLLYKLKELLDAGVITQKEFEAKRKDLLTR